MTSAKRRGVASGSIAVGHPAAGHPRVLCILTIRQRRTSGILDRAFPCSRPLLARADPSTRYREPTKRGKSAEREKERELFIVVPLFERRGEKRSKRWIDSRRWRRETVFRIYFRSDSRVIPRSPLCYKVPGVGLVGFVTQQCRGLKGDDGSLCKPWQVPDKIDSAPPSASLLNYPTFLSGITVLRNGGASCRQLLRLWSPGSNRGIMINSLNGEEIAAATARIETERG